MTDPDTDDPELERRQWLFDHLADVTGGSGNFPPRPLVDALNGLALKSSFDLGWATSEYDPRTEVTTWTGWVANTAVLVEFQARASLANSRGWSGNGTERVTAYAEEPSIELDLHKLDDVVAVHVATRGANDAAEHDHRLQQTWTFTWADETTREFHTDANDATQPADREALCQRLAQHL